MMNSTNLEVAVLEGLRVLPPEHQQEVLDFVEALKSHTESKVPRRSLKGIIPDRDLSMEAFQEARRDVWTVREASLEGNRDFDV